MLNDHDFMRYSRQLLLEDIGPEGQLKLKQSHAVITGLGGLGSPAALYLAAAGVGELTLIDDDEVHLSNLQRQILYTEADVPDNKARTAATRLRALNPALTLNVITERQTRETLQYIVQTADIVLDCTDNMATRHAINAVC
ncbi:HesA/MoeB/ThiF family protein, partial [Morganella morganii]